MNLSIGQLSRPRDGETFNGDRVVIRHDGDRTLLALIDALGHGARAHEVAELAAYSLEAQNLALSPDQILERVDVDLRGSRGAAVMLCLIEGPELQGCGIGNVALRTDASDVHPLLTPGILGHGFRGRARRLRPFSGAIRAGSRLVLFSDGISARLALAPVRGLSPDDACRAILDEFGRSHDDATVIVVDVSEG